MNYYVSCTIWCILSLYDKLLPRCLGCAPTGFGNSLQSVLGGTLQSSFYTSGSLDKPISKPSDLQCNLSRGPQFCRWRNDDTDYLGEWFIANGVPDPRLMKAITFADEMPASPFLVAGTPHFAPAEKGIALVSDPVVCILGDAALTFKHWLSPGVKMWVCLRHYGSLERFHCSQFTAESPGPTTFRIPGPIDTPFEMVIEAFDFTFLTGPFQGGLAMLDDIVFDANMCDDLPNLGTTPSFDTTIWTPFTTLPPRTLPPTQSPAFDACQVLHCDMEQASICTSLATIGSSWSLRSGRTGNQITGIPSAASGSRSDSYLVVQGPLSNDEAIIVFPPVHLSLATLLRFQYYLASFGAKLAVCLINNEQCVFTSPLINLRSRRWKSQVILLSPGTYEISFIASGLGKNAYIGLDDLELVDETGSQVCDSSDFIVKAPASLIPRRVKGSRFGKFTKFTSGIFA